MKFARFEAQGEVAYGVVEGEQIRQITATPFTPYQLTSRQHPLSQARLLAPVAPSKVLGLGLNYKSHLGDQPAPKQPEVFYKAPSAVIGPGDTILLPRGAGRVDEEAELVVVMGRRCCKTSPAEALSFVLGYTCGNDVSARVWQRGDRQWWRAKGSDTFCPVGPYIVTDLDGSHLDLWARVNGQEVQHGNTLDLLYDIPTLISFISQVVTLEPGDLIFTGTPGRPVELHDGDVVEVEVQGIGTLRNPVQAER